MAKPPMPSQLAPTQAIPAPYPQSESDYPGGARFGFMRPGPIVPSANGNLGFETLAPSDAFAQNPDPGYKPMMIIFKK